MNIQRKSNRTCICCGKRKMMKYGYETCNDCVEEYANNCNEMAYQIEKECLDRMTRPRFHGGHLFVDKGYKAPYKN